MVPISVFLLSSCTDPSPRFTVISFMPPKDFDALLILNDEIEIQGHKSRTAWEIYTNFYINNYMENDEHGKINNVVLRVTANGESFKINLDTEIYKIENNTVTLDLKNRSVVQGTTLFRTISLNFLRIGLYFVVASSIFYCFGYRKRRSWIAFSIINLPFEIIVSILMTGASYDDSVMLRLMLFVALFGVPVLLLKILAMCVAIKEHRQRRTCLYVFTSAAVIVTLYLMFYTFIPC